MVGKLILNSMLGGVLIWIINVIGGIWSFHIGLNLWTSILVGILGCSRCFASYTDKSNGWSLIRVGQGAYIKM